MTAAEQTTTFHTMSIHKTNMSNRRNTDFNEKKSE